MERVSDRAQLQTGRQARRSRGRSARMLLLALLTAAALSALAGSASAVIVHLSNGKALSYQPLRGAKAPGAQSLLQPFAGGNLIYHGGPVMTSNTNYTFYWAPSDIFGAGKVVVNAREQLPCIDRWRLWPQGEYRVRRVCK